jgi:MoxR-like ATPase
MLNIAKATKVLQHARKAKRAAFFWGPPGIGKSDAGRAAAESDKVELIDVRLSQLDPVDIRGTPHVKDGKTHWAPPNFLPTGGEGYLFLDEATSAAQSVQAAAYQLVLDRKLGDYVLPDGWAVIMAGNRQEDKAIVHRMSSALANRLIHLEMEHPDFHEWTQWAVDNDIHTDILGFLRFKSSLLFDFNPNAKANPTPRSWHILSDMLHQDLETDIEADVIKGTVGDGAATEFRAYTKIARDLPHPDTILMDPKGSKVPKDPAALYAISGALACRATPTNIERLCQYLDRIPADFQVLCMKDSVRRNPEVGTTRDFNIWASKNASVLS